MITATTLTGLRQLELLADAAKAAKHPTLPTHARIPARYKDKKANDLTRAIVDFLNLSGHSATRLQSTGTYRADLRKFVRSQQRRGMPDVSAVVNGRAFHIEVKVGKDRLSNDQRDAIADLLRAGAAVYIASNFQGFLIGLTDLYNPQPYD